MKYRTEIVREGEDLGPVDWSYDFRQHFNSWCTSDEKRDEACARHVAVLREAATRHDHQEPIEVRVNGEYWKPVYSVCMYDGWPFWRPTPYYRTGGVLGLEWHPFYAVDAVRPPGGLR